MPTSSKRFNPGAAKAMALKNTEERSLEPTEPIEPTTVRLTLLKAARDRQEKELADLQAKIDELSDDFATRAESIVRLGLQSSYIKARQRIGAIDLSFFGDGAELPHSNNLALMSTIEAEITA